MKFGKLLIALLLLAAHIDAEAKFEGELILIPDGCEATRTCVSKYALHFTDPNGIGWEARAGLPTDGATIPPWAQPFIGKPYDRSFIKAAVVHDHYCVRHVRPWRQTHKAFYDALVDLGVPSLKAKLMYYAVYLGGPKWIKLVVGKNCGPACVNVMKAQTNQEGIKIRESSYTQAGFTNDLKEVETLLSDVNKSISLEDLEKRAIDKRPKDIFYENGDVLTVEDIPITE